MFPRSLLSQPRRSSRIAGAALIAAIACAAAGQPAAAHPSRDARAHWIRDPNGPTPTKPGRAHWIRDPKPPVPEPTKPRAHWIRDPNGPVPVPTKRSERLR